MARATGSPYMNPAASRPSRSTTRHWLSAGALAAALSLGACGGGGGALSVPTGGLVVQMHDSPISSTDSVTHVYVTIDSVEVARVEDGEEVHEPIASSPGKYDLLELQHGVEAVIGGGSFPAGDYRWIRLIV